VDFKGKKIVAGYSVDLREHKRMMAALEDTTKKSEFQLNVLNMVIKTANIGLWDMNVKWDDPLNPENHIIWSDEFRRNLGFKDEKDFPNVLGMWSSRLHPDDAKRVADAIMAHWADTTGNTPYDCEFRIMRKDGEYAYISASSTTVRDADGYPVRSSGTLIDMTEIKNLIDEAESQRKEADSANKAKSEFLSHISHEIRTPMNAILCTAEIQLQKGEHSPEIEEAFSMIYGSGNLLLNIINDILDLSKIEAGKLEIIPARYDIPSIIYDTVQLNLLRYESRSIAFELIIDESTPLDMIGDELRIKQILNNIISNAFKYTGKGKVELSVSAETGDDMSGKDENSLTDCILVFRISDTGQGMTKDQIDKLFDEYTRFNTDSNRTIVGTGLGMHITNRMVDAMGGEILVESEIDKGSIFTVRLPQKRIGTTVCGTDLAEQLSGSRFKSTMKMNRAQIVHEFMPYGSVLVVDDVESNLYVAKGMLLPYGLNIETVTNGFDAIEKVKEGIVYDVIFMDHMMPRMDGLEATKIIRESGYNHPVVAMTANAVAGSSEMFLTNGFDGFISKPVDIRELNSLLNRMIRDKQPKEIAEAARAEMTQRKQTTASSKPNMVTSLDNEMKIAVLYDIENVISVLDELLSKRSVLSEEDVKLYTTTVHGAKSTLANVGEKDLSAAAYGLEKIGNDKKIDEIILKTPAFVKTLKNFLVNLKPGSAVDSDGSAAASDADIAFLREKLKDISEACARIKKSEAKAALNALKQKAWPHEVNSLLDEISENLLLGKFKVIIALTEEYLAADK
jgi:PAS domain S-box-containing protein